MINDYLDELTHDATNDRSNQSIVGTAGTAIVGAKVKGGGAAGDWGTGAILKPFLRCVDALVGATGGLQVDLVTADNEALTTNPVVLATRTIAAGSLLANTLHSLPLPAPGTRKAWFGVKLTPLTTNSTAGSVIVGLQPVDALPQDRVNAL